MQPVQLSLIPDPVLAAITGSAQVVELTPMIEQLPAEEVAAAIALLAKVIAKAMASMRSGAVGDE